MIERIGEGMSGRSWAVPLSGVAIGAILRGAEAADGDWAAGRGSRCWRSPPPSWRSAGASRRS